MKRLTIAAALILATTALAVPGKPNPYLGQAKVFYQGLEYEKCLARLESAAKWQSEPAEQVELELYAGLCHFNIGNLDEAQRRFDLALGLDPKLQLPPYTSPRIVDIFESSRKKVEAKLAKQAAPAKQTPPPEKTVAKSDAPKDTRLTPEPKSQPDVQIVDAGSSGKSLVAPIALGGVAVASFGVGAYFGMQEKGYETQANAARFESDAYQLTKKAEQSATMANVAFGVAATAAIAAAVSYLVQD